MFKKSITRLLLCLMTAALFFVFSSCKTSPVQGLFVEILDVGQSDCTLIRQGKTVLMIDCGTVNERNAVKNALADRNVERIDYLLLTHGHEDHIGNARMLLETYTVGALILSPARAETLDERLVLEAAEQNGVPCYTASAGDVYAIGDAKLEILYAASEAEDLNEASIVSRLCYGEMRFLFTGDAEELTERALLALGVDLDCDFLKAGHHGSNTSTSAELLAAVTPCHVAISCGEDNDYGFPHRELLVRLEEMGITWHRTDKEGTLIYDCDGKSIEFIKEE